MAKLLAYFSDNSPAASTPRWSKEFTENIPVSLGRTEKSQWIAEWEASLSRHHAELVFRAGRLHVEVVAAATNPLSFKGQAYPPGSRFVVQPGERFALHDTYFVFEEDVPAPSANEPEPTVSKTVRASDLKLIPFVDAELRLAVIADFHAAIREASDDVLDVEVLKVLIKGIALADGCAVVSLPPRDAPKCEARTIFSQMRNAADPPLKPSSTLIISAIHKFKDPVIHTWDRGTSSLITPDTSGRGLSNSPFDWAFCVPVTSQHGGDRLGIYVTGHFPSKLLDNEKERDDRVNRDLKFAELISKIYASHRRVAALQRKGDALARFLSPALRQALAHQEIGEALREREVTVTVLFCDLRGSTRISEEGAADLKDLWRRISGALSLMTGAIVDQDGVIGDFQGDAAMGFWGWPLETPDQVERAARAALSIRRGFHAVAHQSGHPLNGFACGVGIAQGRAVAGALGTNEQFKISVYGPPVNLAARLESLTKTFGVPIVIDETAAASLAKTFYAGSCRKLAKILPYGLVHPLVVHELFDRDASLSLAEDFRDDYAVALDQFVAGSWENARRKLQDLHKDGPSKLILNFMNENPKGPPKGWDGVITFASK